MSILARNNYGNASYTLIRHKIVILMSTNTNNVRTIIRYFESGLPKYFLRRILL